MNAAQKNRNAQVWARVDESVHRRARAKAVLEGRTFSDVVNDLLLSYLAEKKEAPSGNGASGEPGRSGTDSQPKPTRQK